MSSPLRATPETGRTSPASLAQEEARLSALVEHRILDTVPETVFDDLAQLAAQVCGTPMASVSLVDRHRQWRKAAVGLERGSDDRRYSFCSHAVAGRSTLVVPDATQDERFAANPLVTGPPFLRCYAGVPLVSADGYVLGALCVLDTVPRVLTDEQISALEALARQAGLALQFRRQALDLADSEMRYRLVAENSTDMILQLDAQRRMLWVSPSSRAVLGYEPDELIGRFSSMLTHPDDRERNVVELASTLAAGGTTSVLTYRALHRDGRTVPVETTVQATLADGELCELQCAIRDVSDRHRAESRRFEADRRFQLTMDHAPTGMGLIDPAGCWLEANRSLADLAGRTAADLIGQPFDALVHPDDGPTWAGQRSALLDGRAAGAGFEVRWARADGTTIWVCCSAVLVRDDEGTGHSLVVHVQDITDRRAVGEELARRATIDPLSGLPNRTVLTECLSSASGDPAHPIRIGVLFIDLDHFKAVNDSLGHSGGDELIRQVATRLREATRSEDTVARLGGDEFVVVCRDVRAPRDLRAAASRLRAALKAPFIIGGRPLLVTASIGVALGSRVEADVLLGQADAAMYRAKELGRDRIETWPAKARSMELSLLPPG